MIRAAPASPEGARVAHLALASLAVAQGAGSALAEAGGGPPPSLHDPIPVYHIALAALNDSVSTRDARRIGWRYLVSQGDDLRTVDVDDGAEPRVIAITRGDSVTNLVNASLLAEQSDDDAQRYQVRILELGRAGPASLWLHADAGTDRFFSLESNPRAINERELLSGASRKAAARTSLYRRQRAASALVADRHDDEMGG
jgi:hypothetical protein